MTGRWDGRDNCAAPPGATIDHDVLVDWDHEQLYCPQHVRLNRSPYASMMVSSSMNESPEGQEMSHSVDRPLRQLALPKYVGDLRFCVSPRVRPNRLDALRSRLACPDEAVEPPYRRPGQHSRDRGQDESDDDAQRQGDLLQQAGSQPTTGSQRVGF